MKNLIFIILPCLISLGKCNPPDGNDGVNQGASTSSQLTDCEESDLFNHAEFLARFMMSQDVGGQDLTYMIDNQYGELQAFYNEINSVFIQVEYGANGIRDVVRRLQRLKIFSRNIQVAMLETLFTACADHFNLNFYHTYNRNTDTMLLHQNITSSIQNCMCENNQELEILNSPLVLLNHGGIEIDQQVTFINNQRRVDDVQPYHIIPQSLIDDFLRTWLTNSLSDPEYDGVNNCSRILYGRLRRSIMKVLIVKMRMSRLSNVQQLHEILQDVAAGRIDAFYVSLAGRGDYWLSGNVFLGPRNRGPSSPALQNNGRGAFEIDSRMIIGDARYQQALYLNNILQDYVSGGAERMTPFESLTTGFCFFIIMTHFLGRSDVTPMNPEDWQLMAANGQEFWTIRKEFRRQGRSVTNGLKTISEQQQIEAERVFKNQWRDFVNELLQISLKHPHQESYSWMCNITCLYKDYLKCKYSSVKDQCHKCYSFDEFLYSKISGDWKELVCDMNQNSQSYSNYCQAWKNIQNDLETKVILIDGEKMNHDYSYSERLDSYLENVGAIVRWLSTKVNQIEKQKKSYQLPTFRHDPIRRPSKSSNWDELWCVLTTWTSFLFLSNPCPKLMGKP